MATTTRLIQLRPIYRPSTTCPISIQFFSSSNTPEPTENSPQTNSASPSPPSPQSSSSFSSYFSDVKASLKQQQANPQSKPPSSPFSFSSSSPNSNASRSPSRSSDLEEIRKNLSEFRRRSAVPPPSLTGSPAQSPQQVSFQELYQSRGHDSSSADPKSAGKLSLDAIRESLRQLRTTTAKNDAMSLSKFKESLKLTPAEGSVKDSPRLIGGGDNLPLSIFRKEIREKESGAANLAMRTEFLKAYTPQDLGKKLRELRPQTKGDWFSLQELNERLMRLREIEEKEKKESTSWYGDLRDSLVVLKNSNNEKPKSTMQMQRLDVLTQLGRTPSYMLTPPKEHLVEKFFHPDNMSAAEKLKLELKKVRDEFKMSESDCGSARVQVAQLTTKIKHLATVLHKKDKHSRKGLQGMVQKRKTLLKYLRRTDWESYCFVLSKLGLRDNPDYKS